MTSIDDNDRDTGYKLFAGWQLNRNFAVEGGYFRLGEFGYTAHTGFGSQVGSAKFQGGNIDALGILTLITDITPELTKDPAVKALRGAVRVALDQGKEALPDLNDARLDKIEGIQLWRAVATAQSDDWTKANDLFKQAQAIPEPPLVVEGKAAIPRALVTRMVKQFHTNEPRFRTTAVETDLAEVGTVLRAMPEIPRGVPYVYEVFRDNIQVVRERLDMRSVVWQLLDCFADAAV